MALELRTSRGAYIAGQNFENSNDSSCYKLCPHEIRYVYGTVLARVK